VDRQGVCRRTVAGVGSRETMSRSEKKRNGQNELEKKKTNSMMLLGRLLRIRNQGRGVGEENEKKKNVSQGDSPEEGPGVLGRGRTKRGRRSAGRRRSSSEKAEKNEFERDLASRNKSTCGRGRGNLGKDGLEVDYGKDFVVKTRVQTKGSENPTRGKTGISLLEN